MSELKVLQGHFPQLLRRLPELEQEEERDRYAKYCRGLREDVIPLSREQWRVAERRLGNRDGENRD